MRHVFCGTSLCNHPDQGKICGSLSVTGAEKNRSFTVIELIASEFLPDKQVGLVVYTMIGNIMGSRNSKSIELWSSDDPTRVTNWVTAGSRV